MEEKDRNATGGQPRKEYTRQQLATLSLYGDPRFKEYMSSMKQEDNTSQKSKSRRDTGGCVIIHSLSEMGHSYSKEFLERDDIDFGSSYTNHDLPRIHYPIFATKVSSPSPLAKDPPEWSYKLRFDNRDLTLLDPITSWEEKALRILHKVRCRELTEFNSKLGLQCRTRFCEFNIALFDLDKESELEPGPRFSDIPDSEYWNLDNSINVISIWVAESDVPFPISIYGTVLARDQNDYRCVYLFKRGRDDPQLITNMDDTLTLTGPYRALSGRGSMFFEFNLKIRGDVEVDDQDFSKGMLQRDAVCDFYKVPRTRSLKSCLSTVNMLYTTIPSAVQASIEVNVLNGKSNFIGKITASTGPSKHKIIMYDSRVEGTELNLGSGGSVSLNRSVVSVRCKETLVLKINVYDDGDGSSEKLKLVLGQSSEDSITRILGSYVLQFKIIWTGVFRHEQPKTWRKVNHMLILS